jgi:nucleoside-diphosphate-sugar epimerase
MKILLIGGTGILGKSFCRLGVQYPHARITALLRTPENGALLRNLGIEIVQGDILQPESLQKAIQGQDVVLNFASAIPRKLKPSNRDWELNDRIRIEGTSNVLNQFGNNDVFYCQAGVVFLYGDHQGAWVDEDSSIFPGIYTHSSHQMEQMFLTAKHAMRGVSFRFSLFYHPEAWHTQTMLKELSKRRFPIIGDGNYYWNMIHAEDAAAAVWKILNEREKIKNREILIVSDDQPVTCGDFLNHLCNLLKTAEPTRIPKKIAKFALGSDIVETLTASFRCKTEKIKNLGWKPAFPSFKEGFNNLLPAI